MVWYICVWGTFKKYGLSRLPNFDPPPPLFILVRFRALLLPTPNPPSPSPVISMVELNVSFKKTQRNFYKVDTTGA